MAHLVSTKKEVIENLKKTPIVQIVCERLGISRATYYRWRKDDKTFANESDSAIVDGSRLINDLAESQLVSAIKDKNLTAIMFWLKHHHEIYGNKVELSGTLRHVHEELSEEQEIIVKQALINANLLKRRKK